MMRYLQLRALSFVEEFFLTETATNLLLLTEQLETMVAHCA